MPFQYQLNKGSLPFSWLRSTIPRLRQERHGGTVGSFMQGCYSQILFQRSTICLMRDLPNPPEDLLSHLNERLTLLDFAQDILVKLIYPPIGMHPGICQSLLVEIAY